MPCPPHQQDATDQDRFLAEALGQLQATSERWNDSSEARAVRDLMDDLGWRPPAGNNKAVGGEHQS